MLFKKQHPPLLLSSFDDVSEKSSKVNYRHSPLFGSDNLRALIVAPSGGGKTNLMLDLLIHENGLRYKNIYLYSKTLNQPKYEFLAKVLNPLSIGFFTSNTITNLIPLEDVKPESIIIFDDLMCDPDQSLIKNYFTHGRHKNIDIFYLIQSYAYINKHCIREQANLIVIFRIDELSLKHIFDDHIIGDMSWGKFKELCHHCWRTHKYGFLSVFKNENMSTGARYRRGIDDYIMWETADEPFSRTNATI